MQILQTPKQYNFNTGRIWIMVQLLLLQWEQLDGDIMYLGSVGIYLDRSTKCFGKHQMLVIMNTNITFEGIGAPIAPKFDQQWRNA